MSVSVCIFLCLYVSVVNCAYVYMSVCVCQRKVSVCVATCASLITELIPLSLTTCCQGNRCHHNLLHWQQQHQASSERCHQVMTAGRLRCISVSDNMIRATTKQNKTASRCSTKNTILVNSTQRLNKSVKVDEIYAET